VADLKLFKQLANDVWEMPKTDRMRVPARIVASREILQQMDEGVVEQIMNVATLPGIVDVAWCMPDGHWGYGFPIGGVAAFDPKQEGVISPGGIGIPVAIRTKWPDLSDEQAIEKAMQPNVSTRPGRGGLGLDELRQKILRDGDCLSIVAGHAWVRWTHKERETGVFSPVPGTHVQLQLAEYD
jgi:hypothetical protein